MTEFRHNKYDGRVAPTENPIIDGDTFDLVVDPGFGLRKMIQSARLRGIDTHEIHFVEHDSPEYLAGMQEREFVEQWFEKAAAEYEGRWPLVVRTHEVGDHDEQGKYGRYLVEVGRKFDGGDLAMDLLAEFNGVEY